MQKIILSLIVLLVCSEAASAQQFGRYVFGVAGPVLVPQSAFSRWNGTFAYLGGGIESRIGNHFAMGGEGGILSKMTSGNGYTTGMAAATPAVHFLAKDSNRKIDPFINFGVSELFSQHAASLPIVHFGGGFNYSVRQRFGLRFEYRHHLWSPESSESVELAAFRGGIVLKL